MATKIIFLDIDGVLNCTSSTSKCTLIEERREITGIDSDKLKRLKRIVAGTGAIIVLISSWKIGWKRFDKEHQWSHAKYMDKKFDKYGMRIYDKTYEKYENKRGTGIKNWLKEHFAEDEHPIWIILDDDADKVFDYDMDMLSHLIQTKESKGLTDKDVDLAIELLKGDSDGS